MQNKLLKKILTSMLCLLIVFSAFTGCNINNQNIPTQIEVIFSVPGEGVEEPDSQKVNVGDKITAPTNPVRANYDFVGWYTDEACTDGNEFSFDTVLTEEIATEGTFFLYAKWSVHVDTFMVSFDCRNDTSIIKVNVVSGEKVNKPADPTKESARFVGWYLDIECLTNFNADTTNIVSNLIVYAKWINVYTVNFITNGGTEIQPKMVDEGSAPNDYTTTRAGYIFSGWFIDTDCTIPYGGGGITANTTLYAKWASSEAKQYTYTFNYNYQGSPASIEKKVVEGEYVEVPTVSAEGKIFMGWYTSNACDTKADLTTKVSADVTVYAKWVDAVSVTFNYNYTNAPEAFIKTVGSGSTVEMPTTPINPNSAYTFAGWSTATNRNPDVIFPIIVSSNVTYYAQWNLSYVFEAEDLDLDDFYGFGFSGGGPIGTGCIFVDEDGSMGASNGRYVSCMNNNGTFIDFVFESDRSIENVTLTFRLSAEIKDISIGDSDRSDGVSVAQFNILVNDIEAKYGQIDITGVPPQSVPQKRPFTNYTVQINLKEGTNHIVMKTNNSIGQGGTMNATAPMVDCLIMSTYSGLTFTKKTGNY
jgi:uncharacterized repeat protein (TIGR02543 family)